ncbi:H-NS histone family protein [Paraburkholderia dipogonis]|uniref:H-NS histone family protein n=1 Tax=Paraburkholderia dipogonis TaxID=1211383 RepID=UPI0038BDAB45
MSKYLELKAQLATLNLKIEVARASEKANAIREIRTKMDEWGIQLRDLQDVRNGRRYVPTKSGQYVPKYRDPDSGATWSGKGREPQWIAGKDRTAFSVDPARADQAPSNRE